MIRIRQEKEKDQKFVFDLIELAFKEEDLSDKREQFLVEQLRKSEAFIPELSLVALKGEEIVGHILLTKIKIKGEKKISESLALAPVSVKPNYQKQGIGGQLIKEAHKRALNLGFESIILLGHENYYPKFGYKKASSYQIKLPFEVPDDNCMAIELKPNSLKNIDGIVEYPKAFFEQ